jgi:Ca-activated chloride channel family protein
MRGVLLVPIAFLLTSPAAPNTTGQAPATSASVAVPVIVRDADRRVVTGLTSDDVQLLVDGKPQAISAVDHEPGPRNVLLLLDTSGSMKVILPAAKTAAVAFLDNLDVGTMALVGGFADKTTFAPAAGFTDDRAALKEGLLLLPPGFPSALYDALGQSIPRLASLPGLRTVVVMTDGDDTASRTSARRVAKDAAAAGVSIWVIGVVNEYVSRTVNTPTGPVVAERARAQPGRELKRLSEDSGGAFVVSKSVAEWRSELTIAAQALARPYVVRFSPVVQDGKTHKLEVRMKAPGRTVLAPKTFRAASLPQ